MEQDGNPSEPTQPDEVGAAPQDYPAPTYQSQPPPGQPTYPPPGYGYQTPIQYAEESQAVLALVMSIVGLVACSGLLCPVGWYFAKKELDGIDAGLRDPTKKDLATAAKIIGIIGTALIGIFVLIFGGFILIAIISAAAGA